MKEKNIQTLLGQMLNEANLPFPACFELKIEKSKSFNFSKVADHQIYYLQKAKGGMYYKIQDTMFGLKPFDAFWMTTPMSFIVICFYKPRKYKDFYFIDVDDYVALKGETKRKSVTKDTLDCSPLVSLKLSYPDNSLRKLDSLWKEKVS